MPSTSYFSFFINKYSLSILAFVVWVGFFDTNNTLKQIRSKKYIQDLEQKKEKYQTQLISTKKTLKKLSTVNPYLEKYAREEHFMKRDSEDVFIIVRDTF